LRAFITFARDAGVKWLSGVSAALARRFIDAMRSAPTPAGAARDSHTAHGYAARSAYLPCSYGMQRRLPDFVASYATAHHDDPGENGIK
jgi:hypothetical protein